MEIAENSKKTQIIDMRGPDIRLMDNLNDLKTDSPVDYAPQNLPEVRYNLKLLSEDAEKNLSRIARLIRSDQLKLKTLQERQDLLTKTNQSIDDELQKGKKILMLIANGKDYQSKALTQMQLLDKTDINIEDDTKNLLMRIIFKKMKVGLLYHHSFFKYKKNGVLNGNY